ncbi:hypothetical protein GQ597_11220 [Gilliamella sp. Pra-s65]|uniref:DnaT-like ssDNA-binding protein n=1 Tax=unclassified Gilliamella TaxID=2685620 RepID=UPI0013653EBA|nr:MULTISPECIES: DnaT-like ssDNA-binding protein [unclassified Gilliamella]MWN91270.1 hypothetical protein [Gilliamella sp. Pra-s65]MWP74246.1 hypothetical protein [Gilliamella sp. Pra-s52]
MINADLNSSSFNSYASIDDLEHFANARDISLPNNKESLLIKAMDYLNGLNWAGKKAKQNQPLPFPRKDIVLDGYSLSSNEIPTPLITAQCMLAIEAISDDLLPSVREAPVKSESIAGALTVAYSVDESGFKPQYTAVMSILGDLVVSRGFSINCIAERS